MELGPSKYESQLPSPQAVVDDFQIVDAHLGFTVGVKGMEVREAVIVEEHSDCDPMETADRWHAPLRRYRRRFTPVALSRVA
jgi:hypothetical protein